MLSPLYFSFLLFHLTLRCQSLKSISIHSLHIRICSRTDLNIVLIMVSFRFFACPIFVIHNLPREQLGNGAMEAGGGGWKKKKRDLKCRALISACPVNREKKRKKTKKPGHGDNCWLVSAIIPETISETSQRCTLIFYYQLELSHFWSSSL